MPKFDLQPHVSSRWPKRPEVLYTAREDFNLTAAPAPDYASSSAGNAFDNKAFDNNGSEPTNLGTDSGFTIAADKPTEPVATDSAETARQTFDIWNGKAKPADYLTADLAETDPVLASLDGITRAPHDDFDWNLDRTDPILANIGTKPSGQPELAAPVTTTQLAKQTDPDSSLAAEI